MNKKSLLILNTFVVTLFIVSLQAFSFAESNDYVGYLSDVMCASKGVSGGGFNLLANPEKHTVACMKMPPCEASGYGIFIKDGESDEYVYYKFGEKGTELAKELLKNTERADNMVIKVKGSMHEDKIMVESITEA